VEQLRSLPWALLRAGGPVGLTIPGLLIPGQAEWLPLTDLVDVSPLPEEQLDEVTCYRLQGRCGWWAQETTNPELAEVLQGIYTAPPGQQPLLGPVTRLPLTVWVDSGSLLVRRIEQVELHERYRKETLTNYEPQVGVAISADELRLTTC
jgi:hypothetical protein